LQIAALEGSAGGGAEERTASRAGAGGAARRAFPVGIDPEKKFFLNFFFSPPLGYR